MFKLFMGGTHRFGVVHDDTVPSVAIFGGGIQETHPYPDTRAGHIAARIHFASISLGRLMVIAEETMREKAKYKEAA